MSVKTGSGRKLQWAIEIEQRSMWEASMWFGPFAYYDRDLVNGNARVIAAACGQANRRLGEDRKYDHFKVTVRQVDWLTVDTLDASASTSPDMFWSRYIQPTLIALENNEYEDEDE